MKPKTNQRSSSPFRIGLALLIGLGLGTAIYRLAKENYGSIAGALVSVLAMGVLAVGFVCVLMLGVILLVTGSRRPRAAVAP